MQHGDTYRRQISFKKNALKALFEGPLVTKQFLHASSLLLTFSFPFYSWGTWSIYILLRHQPSNSTIDAQQQGPSTQLSWYSQSQLCVLLTRWTAWRRHVDGSTFTAIPTEQIREEHTHPVLLSSGTHMQWLSVCRLFTSTAWLCLGLYWKSEMRLWACPPLRPKGELYGIRD